MPAKRFHISLVVLLPLLTACSDSSIFLKGRNYSSGDWLLVNENYVENTLKLIDDEFVMAHNPTGIIVNWSEDDAYTTCDGRLKLYRNGELVAQQDYLDRTCIHESPDLTAAYKKGTKASLYPGSQQEFKAQWDSLKKLPRHYPTPYNMQPDNKDIIQYYTYEQTP